MGARLTPKMMSDEDSQVDGNIVMTRCTRLCTLLGQRNESWGSLSTFTTIEVCRVGC